MEKYTDAQIIEYLKTLREGDELAAAATTEYYTKGCRYEIFVDCDGDLCIYDDEGSFDYVQIGSNYEVCILGLIREGVFEISAKASEQSIGNIRVENVRLSRGDGLFYTLTVEADGLGSQAIHALAKKSEEESELGRLKAQRDALQAQIDELEAAQC